VKQVNTLHSNIEPKRVTAIWNQTFLSLLARSIGEKNNEAPSSLRVTSANKTIHAPPTPHHWRLWCLILFPTGSSKWGTTLHEEVGEGMIIFTLWSRQNVRKDFQEKVSTNFVTDCSSGQSSPLFSQGLFILRFNAAVSFKTVKKLMFLNSLTEDPNKNAIEQKFSKYSWHLNRS